MKMRGRFSLLSSAAGAALALLSCSASAQEFSDVKKSVGPLTLRAQGSFFIGGNVHQVPDPFAGGPSAPGVFPPSNRPGASMINQMYVQYQLPERDNDLPPIVFVHGCCLSSKTWETTPDGRMGWFEYFTRKGYDTYMADQVGRARSGFDALQYQKVRYDADTPEFGPAEGALGIGCLNPQSGTTATAANQAACMAPGDTRPNNNITSPANPGPTALPPTGFYIPGIPGKESTTNPSILIATDMFAWNVFRYGPPCAIPCGAFTNPPSIKPWADEQFPLETIGKYSTPGRRGGVWGGGGGSGTFFKQVIPDLSASLGTFGPLASDVRPTPYAMATLSQKLGGAILVGHSQSSSFPTKAALQDRKGNVKGIIQLETGCFMPGTTLSADDVKVLAKIPILIIEGDHYVTATSPTNYTPQPRPVAPCPDQFAAIGAAGGDITYIHLPEWPNYLWNNKKKTANGRPVGTGNSHMFMQDLNNIAIADVIMDWINGHVKHGRHDHDHH